MTKHSKHNLKRLVERAVTDECRLPRPGPWFCVDEVETRGHPIERIVVWSTPHFARDGSPFCCGEPMCHLGLFGERLEQISNHVRGAMSLTQCVEVDVRTHAAAQIHDGVIFAPPKSEWE
jgi:hypothetical protein